MNRYIQQFFFSFFRSISNHTDKNVLILNKIFIFGNHCVKFGHKQKKSHLKQQLLLVEQTNYYTGGLNIYIFPPLSIIFFVSCRCNLFCKTFHSKLRKTRHIEVSLNAFYGILRFCLLKQNSDFDFNSRVAIRKARLSFHSSF